MAIIRATAVLNKRSNVPKDAARNVWHFENIGVPSAADFTGVGAGLEAFYSGIAFYMAASVNGANNAHRVEMAIVSPGAPGESDDTVSPIQAVRSFDITPSPNSSLPNEVAIALSFNGELAGLQEEVGFIRPKSRRRGRIFVGPFQQAVITVDGSTGEPMVSLEVREAMLDAYDDMQVTMLASSVNLRHVVYSRSNGDAVHVNRVGVDNEFDTIRRRGRKPSLRMRRSVTGGVTPVPRDGDETALAT